MTEKFGLEGIWEDLNKYLLVDIETKIDNSTGAQLPLITRFIVTNGAALHEGKPEIYFDEVELTVGIPPNMHVNKHNDLASGDSFTYEHRGKYSDLGKIVYSISSKVSPSHLLQVKRATSDVPSREASLSIVSYVEVLKDINIHKWLKDIIEKVQIPESNAEAAIEAQQERLRNTTQEIGTANKQLENINKFITRSSDTERAKMNKHTQLLKKYLTNTSRACSELRQMLERLNSKTFDSERNGIVSTLTRESLEVDNSIEDLLIG